MTKIEEFGHLEDYSVDDIEYGFVYYLFYRDILVYIGGTENLRGRIIAHRMTKLFDRVKIVSSPIEEYKLLEINEIAKYNPIYNSVGTSKDSPKTIEIEEYLFVRRFGHIKKSDILITKNSKLYYRKGHFGYILNLNTGYNWMMTKGVANINLVYTAEEIDAYLSA